MSETTPLLAGSPYHLNNVCNVYSRFNTCQKNFITAVISFAGLIGTIASACFVPSIPEIAKDLNTTGTIINYTVGAYIFTVAVGNLAWAPYAAFYGRQPVYMMSLPLVCVGSLGVGLSNNVAQLVISRSMQAFGSSCVLSVGTATISDVYKPEERGTAMGIFLGAVIMGPMLGPLMGGITATYASWRVMQFLILLMGMVACLSVAAFLPETSHPGSRGIDRLHAQGWNERPDGSLKECEWKWVWLNPFKPLYLLRGPVVLLVSLAATLSLATFFVLIMPLSYTLGPRYGITNPALIGACLIPSGLGNMVGAMVAGRLADRALIDGRNRREGKSVPEDRLRAAVFGALILIPISVLGFGLAHQYLAGTWGLAISLVCLFMNGAGVDVVLTPSTTYLVDILRSQSVEVMASYTAFRSVICALASAFSLPMVNQVGIVAMNGFVALLEWTAFVLLIITICNGERLRSWLDLGYTTLPDES